MSFISYIYFFIFVLGIVCGFNIYTFIIYIFSILQIIFIKEKYISLTLLMFFLSGNILSLSMYNVELKESLYKCNMKIIRSYKYSYIGESKSIKYILNTNINFFEGDIVEGIFQIKRVIPNNDYNKFLIDNGVYYNALIKKIDKVYYDNDIYRFRNKLINKIKSMYNNDIASLINSVLLGYKRDMNRELKDMFKYSGLMHFLAISGLHIGILYMFIVFLLLPLPIKKYYKDIICILFLIFYAYLTYLNPPVLRAVIFLSLYIIVKMSGYETDWDKVIVFTAITIILFNPYYIKNTGFWLSFMSVYAINKTPKTNYMIFNLFLISIFIMIINAPLLLYKFKSIYFLSPIMTIIILPLFYLFLPFSLFSIFLNNHTIIQLNIFIFNLMKNIIMFSSKLNLSVNMSIDKYLLIMLIMYIFFTYEKRYFMGLFISLFILLYSLNFVF